MVVVVMVLNDGENVSSKQILVLNVQKKNFLFNFLIFEDFLMI